MPGDILGVPDSAVRRWVIKRLDLEESVLKNAEHDTGTLTFDKVV
jgi:hypothetical protein